MQPFNHLRYIVYTLYYCSCTYVHVHHNYTTGTVFQSPHIHVNGCYTCIQSPFLHSNTLLLSVVVWYSPIPLFQPLPSLLHTDTSHGIYIILAILHCSLKQLCHSRVAYQQTVLRVWSWRCHFRRRGCTRRNWRFHSRTKKPSRPTAAEHCSIYFGDLVVTTLLLNINILCGCSNPPCYVYYRSKKFLTQNEYYCATVSCDFLLTTTQ